MVHLSVEKRMSIHGHEKSFAIARSAAHAVLALCALAACSRDHGPASQPPVELGSDEPELFDPEAPFARPQLCERVKDDAVRDVFCAPESTPVRSLRQLQARLGFNTLPDSADDAQAESLAVDPNALVGDLVYLGHSTALSGQLVSSINPRALLLGRQAFLAYQRGVQQVEVIARDRESLGLNFYLVSFKQACNDLAGGCKPGDLYTQHVERDWIDVALRDDQQLKNTPFDCRQCHQRGRAQPTLLMRELRGPWTHFFGPYDKQQPDEEYRASAESNARTLTADFLYAKGGEAYAGLPAFLTRHTAGLNLELRVGGDQPLTFDSEHIDLELEAAELAGQPRRSRRWDDAYAAFKRGEQLPLPHFEPRPTDPDKLAALSDAYRRYRSGELPRDELPDLSDVFPDDPRLRAEIGLQNEPDASGAELLVQVCGSCHNDALDQTVSRARFNIALARMPRDELDLAIRRIELPRQHARVMPPEGARQLDAAARARLVRYLKENRRSTADDALLQNAAARGMAFDPYDQLGI
jgi:mono/diheme cytochrome c family protein